MDSGREEQPARILQGNGNSGSVIAVSSNVSTPFSDSSDISRLDHLPTEGDSGRGGGGYGGRSDMSAFLPLTNRLAHGGFSRRGADNSSQLAPSCDSGRGENISAYSPDGNVWIGAGSTNNVPMGHSGL